MHGTAAHETTTPAPTRPAFTYQTDEYTAVMTTPEFRNDPYPLWARLRSEDPVHRDPMGMWTLTRFADVDTVLHDHARFSSAAERFHSRRRLHQRAGREALVDETLAQSMLQNDPPDHTRLRRLVNKAFTPRQVEALRPRIERIVDDLLTRVAADRRMDLISDFAGPLPVTVISELLGVPLADQDRIRDWSRRMLDHATFAEPTAEMLDEIDETVAALLDYLKDLIALRRREPDEGLIAGLIAVRDTGDERLSEDELLSTCLLLLIAGHETTINLIGNGTLALLHAPDQLRLLREDPGLVRHAVEELLRYDSPVQMTARAVTQDTEIGGVRVSAGDEVLAVLGAANRDPARFSEPDKLDVTRADVRHLSFGTGIHFCLGAPLARIEGEVAFRELVSRFPDLSLTDEPPVWRPGNVLRGLDRLVLTFHGS